jgi:VanZ family protein
VKPVYIVFTVLYCAGIFWLSSQPVPLDVKPPFPGADKVAHALLYAGLAGIVSVGLHRSPGPRASGAQHLVPIVFALVYGLSDEIHQIFVPNRSFDLLDLLADLVGAAAMQAILWAVWRRRGADATSATSGA